MKLTLAVLAVIFGTTFAALPSNDYLPPLEDASPTSNVDLQTIGESSPLSDDGYRYKTVKRLRLRHRRDVNELPSNEYLPPGQSAPAVADIPVVLATAFESAQSQDSAVLADDGYRYKTVKRIRYRHRRDVNELPSNEYLPPAEETAQVVEEIAAPAEESAVLADDGYRYKTVKRIRYRHRRDVNELPSNEYLPALEEKAQVVEEIAAPVEESAVLADDGYRYKTVKRIRYRHRRDVNELPSNEYLPALEEKAQVVEEIAAPVEESAVLADDGYRYKTVKRIRYRHRRDVNELPSNEYLPALEEKAQVVEEIAAPVEESAVLADDGYRYKTVKRIRYRHRRDVNELPSNEYLPPAEETAQVVEEIAAPVEESAVLADDGYRYKTVKRIRYRHRRDVNELPSNEYLPALEEKAQVVEENAAPVEESAVLADDGYRYKTVKRIRYRHRRDVNELPSNEYLPALEEKAQVVEEIAAPVEESAVLADDGYRYKTVKRIRYRHRRDVNELPSNEYLPALEEKAQVVEEIAESAVLADDGYRYKTVKRIRYRHRRDVNEFPSNEYLPALEEKAQVVEEIAAPAEESAVLADDGYRYKTVKRIRYRHRRDVNELPSNEYLPPGQQETQVIEEVVAPAEDSAVLSDDGYRYKTAKRVVYRHRF